MDWQSRNKITNDTFNAGHNTFYSAIQTFNPRGETPKAANETFNTGSKTFKSQSKTKKSGNKTLNPASGAFNSTTDALTVGTKTLNSATQTLNSGCKTKNTQSGSYIPAVQSGPVPVIFEKTCLRGLFFNKRWVFLITETKPWTMNTHFEITHAKEHPSEKYFSRRIGLSAHTKSAFQPDNREKTAIN